MSDSSKDLGTDLYNLEKVAKNYLPSGANVYGTAISKCASDGGAPKAMAQVPEQFHGDHGPVSEGYGKLHDAIVDILKSTQTSLEETGKALHEAAQLYADNDSGAKQKLDGMSDDLGEITPEVKS